MHRKLPRAITFDLIVGFSSSIPFQKQEVKIFPKVSRSTQSMAFWRWRPLKGCRLENRAGAIKSPKHPSNQKKKLSLGSALCRNIFYIFFLSSKHKKHIKSSWFFSSPKIHGIILIPNLLLLGSTSWIWNLGVC